MKVFQERLKHLERVFDMHTADLADYLGVPPATVKGWEVGCTEPSLEQLHDLGEYFESPTDYLLGLDHRLMVDASGLDKSQIRMLRGVILVLSQSNIDEQRKAEIIPIIQNPEEESKRLKFKKILLFKRYVGYRLKKARFDAGVHWKDVKAGNPYAVNTLQILERGHLNSQFNDANIGHIASCYRTTPEEILKASSLDELKYKIAASPEPYLREYVVEGKKLRCKMEQILLEWYEELDTSEIHFHAE